MGRREQNKREKRDRLLAEGLTLFLEQGYDLASIEQIAAASGVARGTFYLYFPDKLSLFESLVDRWYTVVMGLLEDVDTRLCQATTRAQAYAIYREMAVGLALVALSHAKEVQLAFREARRVGEVGERLRERELGLLDRVTLLTRHGAERGLITAEDPRLVTFVIMGGVEKLFYEYMRGNPIGEPATVAASVLRLFAKALDLPAEG